GAGGGHRYRGGGDDVVPGNETSSPPGRDRGRSHHHREHDERERAVTAEDVVEHVPDGEQLDERPEGGDQQIALEPHLADARHDHGDGYEQEGEGDVGEGDA